MSTKKWTFQDISEWLFFSTRAHRKKLFLCTSTYSTNSPSIDVFHETFITSKTIQSLCEWNNIRDDQWPQYSDSNLSVCSQHNFELGFEIISLQNCNIKFHLSQGLWHDKSTQCSMIFKEIYSKNSIASVARWTFDLWGIYGNLCHCNKITMAFFTSEFCQFASSYLDIISNDASHR